MDWLLRKRCLNLALPPDPAGPDIDVIERPAVLVSRLGDVSAAHRPAKRPCEVGDYGIRRLTGSLRIHGCHDKDVIVPHDGRAPTAAGNVDAPGDVLRRRPGIGQPWIVRRDAGLGSTELLPVLRLDGAPRQGGHDEDG